MAVQEQCKLSYRAVHGGLNSLKCNRWYVGDGRFTVEIPKRVYNAVGITDAVVMNGVTYYIWDKQLSSMSATKTQYRISISEQPPLGARTAYLHGKAH